MVARSVEGLQIVERGDVVEVTIDRGEGNLMSLPMCRALTALLRDPPAGSRVCHLRASGPAFCLGRDRGARDVDELRAEATTLVDLNRALADGHLVTVAEVAGDAAGYGVGLAALCDVSIAGPSARFWFPEIEAGLAPTVVLAWLPRLVGRAQAFYLTATATRIDGAEAARIGLVTRAVGRADDLAAEASGVVAALARLDHRAHREIRDYLRVTAALDEAATDSLAIDRLVLGSLRLAAAAPTAGAPR